MRDFVEDTNKPHKNMNSACFLIYLISVKPLKGVKSTFNNVITNYYNSMTIKCKNEDISLNKLLAFDEFIFKINANTYLIATPIYTTPGDLSGYLKFHIGGDGNIFTPLIYSSDIPGYLYLPDQGLEPNTARKMRIWFDNIINTEKLIQTIDFKNYIIFLESYSISISKDIDEIIKDYKMYFKLGKKKYDRYKTLLQDI